MINIRLAKLAYLTALLFLMAGIAMAQDENVDAFSKQRNNDVTQNSSNSSDELDSFDDGLANGESNGQGSAELDDFQGVMEDASLQGNNAGGSNANTPLPDNGNAFSNNLGAPLANMPPDNPTSSNGAANAPINATLNGGANPGMNSPLNAPANPMSSTSVGNVPNTSDEQQPVNSTNPTAAAAETEMPANAGTAIPASGEAQELTPAAVSGQEGGIAANDFQGTPAMPGSIREMAEGEAPEIYEVEPGDTLYDICDQLLDEPGYWPKLWAFNPEIKNPHYIFPGMKLVFYSGNNETPPTLEIMPETDIPIAEEQMAPIILGDHIPANAAVINATEVVTSESLAFDESVNNLFMFIGQEFNASDLNLRIPGFFSMEGKTEIGQILKGFDANQLLPNDTKTVLSVAEGIQVGSRYTILRERPFIDEGYIYDYVANIEIDQKIESGEKAIGTIKDQRIPVRSGDLIVPYISSLRMINQIDRIGTISNTEANIIGFDMEGQSFGEAGNMVFINRGSNQGINVGQYFFINQDIQQLRLHDEDADDHAENIGVVRIIDTTPDGAVGLVVNSLKEIRTGDRIGTSKG